MSKRSAVSGSTWPENAEYWIKIIREGLDPYRLELTNAAMLTLVAPGEGMTLLDAGCGEGYLSRLFAERGAKVTGIDGCARFVEAAQQAADLQGLDAKYDFGAVESLPYAEGTFDVVVANHVLNELPAIEPALREFARVLKPGGRFVTMMLHPCFYRPNTERMEVVGFAPPKDYFGEREVIQEFLVSGLTSPAKVRMWLRPLEVYTRAVTGAGLLISALNEPHPTSERLETEWWRSNFPAPLFLQIEGTKLA